MAHINESQDVSGAARPAAITFHEWPDLSGVSDRQIVTDLVDVCLTRGYALSVYSNDVGSAFDVVRSRCSKRVIDAIYYAGETSRLYAYGEDKQDALAWFDLMPVNASYVICDSNETQLVEDLVLEVLTSVAKEVTP